MSRLVRVALALLWGMAGSIMYASTTSVTATLTDSDGQTWNNCVWSAFVVSNYPPTIGGVPVPESQLRANGSCDASGALSATMLNPSSVQQSGVSWTFTIQPNAAVAPSVVSGVVWFSGTVDLSTVLSAGIKAPRFGAGPNSYGYADAEVNSSSIGNTYFNTGSVCGGPSLRQLSNAGWQCGGSAGSGGITQLTGDVLAGPGSGTQVANVAAINTAPIPQDSDLVATNNSRQLIKATSQNVDNTLGSFSGGGSVGISGAGDSIMNSQGATDPNLGFFPLLKYPIGGPWTKNAISGSAAVTAAAYIMGDSPVGGTTQNFIMEYGTNEANLWQADTSMPILYQRVFYAGGLWRGVNTANKKYAQSASCTKTVGFATTANEYIQGLGLRSTTNGDALTCTVTTSSNGSIGIGYAVFNLKGGTFTVSVNGTPVADPLTASTTWNAFPDGNIDITTNGGFGSTQTIAGAILTGLTPNTAVTVRFDVTSATSANNIVEPLWVNTFPAASLTTNPFFITVSPNHQNGATDTYTGQYVTAMQNVVTALKTAGVNAIYANTRDALGTNYATYYADALHPNNAGHALMASTIQAAIVAVQPLLVQYSPPNIYNNLQVPWTNSPPRAPAQFPSLNPWNVGDGVNTWSPGLLLFRSNYGAGWVGGDTARGAYLAASDGGASNLCSGLSTAANTFMQPSSLSCQFTAVNNTAYVSRSTTNSNVWGWLTQLNGDSYAGATDGPTGLLAPRNLFLNHAHTIFGYTALATSSANANSLPLQWRTSVWSGTAAIAADVSLVATPATGANPFIGLRLNCFAPTTCGLDLSTTTGQNNLGPNSVVGTLAGTGAWSTTSSITAGTSLTANGVLLLPYTTTYAFTGSSLAAGACSHNTITVGSGLAFGTSIIDITPEADPGDATYYNARVLSGTTIDLAVCSVTAATPNSITYNIRVWR